MQNISFWNLIKEDFTIPCKNDPALHSFFEIFFNYPGIWSIINYRFAHYLYKKGFKFLSRTIMGINQIISNIDIHPAATIGRRVFIDHGFGVVIGETSVIEDDVLIYQGVTLGGVNFSEGKRHPTIKSGAVIGSGSKILGNITIGISSKIGANSVVVKDVPDNSTAVGIPARVIQKGRDKNPLAHNKLPDINKEMFQYLIKRVAVLEHALVTGDYDILEKDVELEHIYESFINAVK